MWMIIMYRNQQFYIEALLWIAPLCSFQALASCQVYPSGYAYLDLSVTRFERPSANCSKYPSRGIEQSVMVELYFYCNGTQLRLTDSDLGSEQYITTEYYVWAAGSSASQLLFIFPTRVNLTTITLHYYSDNFRGLPRLRFYAVPDDFDVWDASSISYSSADISAVPPDSMNSHRSVSTNVNFSTTKILMYKLHNEFLLAISEVEFLYQDNFNYHVNSVTTNLDVTSTSTHIPLSQPGTKPIEKTMTSNHQTTTGGFDVPRQNKHNLSSLVAGVIVTVLILVTSILVLSLLLLLWHKRKTHKNKITCNLGGQDEFHSTFDRGLKQLQTQSQDVSTELYDQIQLSPSTGQSELISKVMKNENVTMFIPPTQLDCKNIENTHKMEPQKSNSEFATYAVVDKKKKISTSKIREQGHSTPGKGTPLSKKESVKDATQTEHDNSRYQDSEVKQDVEEMYAVVHKKPRKCKEQEEIAPPLPSHTMESLYTAVKTISNH